MTRISKSRGRVVIALLAALLAFAAYLISCIPYQMAEAGAPDGVRFIGQMAVSDDINSYYSFIRQAAEGHWVFRNAMTHMEHRPAFVNVEWLVAGWGMALFDWSTRTVYEVWRMAGALTAVGAFAVLALIVLPTQRERVIALLMFSFGGGFGWLIYSLAGLGIIGIHSDLDITNPAMDISTATHPFGQIVKNPHFALPHGTFILLVAAFVMGERSRKRSWYMGAAVLTFIHGLIRPYDLISLYAILPAFIVAEAALDRKLDWRPAVDRALPLLVAAPLLVYYVYIFSYHPVFKYWASQGLQPAVPVVWHLLSFGLAGFLCVWRLASWRRFPLQDPAERFLVVWVIVLLALYHGNRLLDFMPYTPQLGVPLVTPMILLGVVMFRRLPDLTFSAANVKWYALVAVFLLINALSTPLYVVKTAQAAVADDRNYIRVNDLRAIEWLEQHVAPTDVVVTDYAIGTKLGQLVSARILIGHWALTPRIEEISDRTGRFLRGEMTPGEAIAFLEEINAGFIYVSPRSGFANPEYFEGISNVQLRFENADVLVFEREW